MGRHDDGTMIWPRLGGTTTRGHGGAHLTPPSPAAPAGGAPNPGPARSRLRRVGSGRLSSPPMQEFLSAIQSGASGDDMAAIPHPDSYRAAFVLRDEVGHVRRAWRPRTRTRGSRCTSSDVAVPELAPDEAYIAVMASAINFNTVWTSIFEPLPTFGFLDRLGKESSWGKRHALDYHVVGSDAVRGGAPDRLGGAELESRGQGHRPLQLRGRPEPERPR